MSDFESLKKKHESLQAGLAQSDLELDSIKATLVKHEGVHSQHQEKIKELGETTYKLDSIQIPSINSKLGRTASDEELKSLRLDVDKVNPD